MDRRALVAFDRDDIETHDVLRISAMTRGEQRRGAYQLALLVAVNREFRVGESRRAPAANFDECEAIPIEQNQVNFAAARTKVPRDRLQTPVNEKAKRELFCVLA